MELSIIFLQREGFGNYVVTSACSLLKPSDFKQFQGYAEDNEESSTEKMHGSDLREVIPLADQVSLTVMD
jgi:hypothetical protein